MSRKKIIALAVAGFASASAFESRSFFNTFGNEGPADFLRPRPFGSKEKSWGKKNRRKLGGINGGAK